MARNLMDDDAPITVLETDLEGVVDPQPDVTYTIRQITDAKWREMQKAHTTQVLNKQTGRREPQIDWPAVSDDALDYLLEGWSGITARGEPAPCERPQKLKLDGVIKSALFERARLTQTADQQVRSFRVAPDVRGTVD